MGRRASICNGTLSWSREWLQIASTKMLLLVVMMRVLGWRHVSRLYVQRTRW
jgi:hypothetical protein